MKWSKRTQGFVLWDVLVYALLAALSITLFVIQLRQFLQWYDEMKKEILDVCHHSSLALSLYTEGSIACSYAVIPEGLVSFEGYTYSKEWKRQSWITTYKIVRNEVFCEKSIQADQGDIVKHTLYKCGKPLSFKSIHDALNWSFEYQGKMKSLWRYKARKLSV